VSRTRPPAGTARQPGAQAPRPHDAHTDETPAAVGNHAMTRLLASGSGALKAHPAIAGLAGNRAVQRLVAPVQRIEGEKDDKAPQPTGGYIPQTHTAGTRTGPLPGSNNDGRPPLVAPEPVQVPMPGSHREADPNRGEGASDSHPVDSQLFKKGTTLNDGVSAVTGTGGFADFTGFSDHFFGTEIASTVGEYVSPGFLPGAALVTGGVGLVEGFAREDAHEERANVMRTAAPLAGGRSADILNAGAQEHGDAATRHRGRTRLGMVQGGLTAGGIITGNPLMLGGAAAIGGLKLIDSAQNKWKQLQEGDGEAKLHAQELMDEALNGDPGALLALRQLGVDPDQLTALEEQGGSQEEATKREVAAWQARRAALEQLTGLMPRQRIPRPDVDPLEEDLTGGTQQVQPDLRNALQAPAAALDQHHGGEDEVPGLNMRNPLIFPGRGTVTDDSPILGAARTRASRMDVPTLDIAPRRPRRRRPPQQQQNQQQQPEQERAQPALPDGDDYVIEHDDI